MGPEWPQVATAKGTVWHPLPQTSQAAEQLQLSRLPMFVPRYGEACYSDCMNAVRLHNSNPLQQHSHKHKYSGLRRGALQHMVTNTYAPAVCTPAHRELSVIGAVPAPE
eukprot:1111484-Pyramimonas_sp.AAC.1